ncbi:hypothetical protein CPB83DRAFT_865550, partial [Crepidotus variabilis]
DEEIAKQASLLPSAGNTTGSWNVSVLFNADEDNEDDEVDLLLRYVVHGVSWTPSYDIHVDTQEQGNNLTVLYKALITQQTGEDWNNASLRLETTSPSSFDPPLPKNLPPWSLSLAVVHPPSRIVTASPIGAIAGGTARKADYSSRQYGKAEITHRDRDAYENQPINHSHTHTLSSCRSRSPQSDGASYRSYADSPSLRTRPRSPQTGRLPTHLNRQYESSPSPGPLTRGRRSVSPGRFSCERYRTPAHSRSSCPVLIDTALVAGAILQAQPQTQEDESSTILPMTLNVSDLLDIPTSVDGQAEHQITIAILRANTKIERYAIPKLDKRVYTMVKLKNNTDMTFVPGTANVSVDKNFFTSTEMPALGPQETFECPLGPDPSIVVIYHANEEHFQTSPTTSRSSVHSYTQRITVQNNKSVPLENLKITERVPISDDGGITLELISPALTLPSKSGSPSSSMTSSWQDGRGSPSNSNVRERLYLGKGVQAQWDKADEDHVDGKEIAKTGKLNWLLDISPMKSVDLVLQFEVMYPSRLSLFGLD